MTGTGQLVRYDEMCRAIDAAYEIDEVSEIRDQARAIELYMQQQRNTEAERRACEIRLRAERKVGKLIQQMERARGKRTDLPTSVHDEPKLSLSETLKSHGISGTQAKRWQKLADVPEDQFEATFAKPAKPSTNAIIAAQKKPESKAEAEQRAMDARALWVWGRLLDFERENILEAEPEILAGEMLDHMRATVRELGPQVIRWLSELVSHVAHT